MGSVMIGRSDGRMVTTQKVAGLTAAMHLNRIGVAAAPCGLLVQPRLFGREAGSLRVPTTLRRARFGMQARWERRNQAG